MSYLWATRRHQSQCGPEFSRPFGSTRCPVFYPSVDEDDVGWSCSMLIRGGVITRSERTWSPLPLSLVIYSVEGFLSLAFKFWPGIIEFHENHLGILFVGLPRRLWGENTHLQLMFSNTCINVNCRLHASNYTQLKQLIVGFHYTVLKYFSA